MCCALRDACYPPTSFANLGPKLVLLFKRRICAQLLAIPAPSPGQGRAQRCARCSRCRVGPAAVANCAACSLPQRRGCGRIAGGNVLWILLLLRSFVPGWRARHAAHGLCKHAVLCPRASPLATPRRPARCQRGRLGGAHGKDPSRRCSRLTLLTHLKLRLRHSTCAAVLWAKKLVARVAALQLPAPPCPLCDYERVRVPKAATTVERQAVTNCTSGWMLDASCSDHR